MFPVVNTIPGFVSVKIESASKFIMGIRKILQMFESKSILFKVSNRNTRTRYKICPKLTINTLE